MSINGFNFVCNESKTTKKLVLKLTKKNNKLRKTIIISTIIHIILFIFIIWNSLDKYYYTKKDSKEKEKTVVTASMVDPRMIIQNFSHKEQKKSTSKYIEKQYKRKQKVQIEKTQKKQDFKQNHFTIHEKEAENFKNQEMIKSQVESQKNLKKSLIKTSIQKTQFNIKNEIKNSKLQNKILEENFIKLANSHKTRMNESTKKLTVEKVKRKSTMKDVDNTFTDLNSRQNTSKVRNKLQKNNSSFIFNDKTKNNDTSDTDISDYAEKIKSVIEEQFYNEPSYSGKQCTLKIRLSPEGILLDVHSEHGDPTLCTAALSAARHAKIPKPPSQEIYKIFRNTSLDFRF